MPKRCSRKASSRRARSPTLRMPSALKLLLRHFAHAGNFAHVERREKGRFLPRNHPQHAIGLGLVGADLGHQARGGDPDGTVQAGLRLHALVQQVRRAQGRPIQALGARHVEVGFVDGGHLHQGRERLQHLVDLVRVVAVALRVAVDENGLRAKLVRRAQRQGRVDAELARRVGCRRDHAALVGPAAHHHRLALERRIEQFFHGDKEGVHIQVEVGPHGCMSAGPRVYIRQLQECAFIADRMLAPGPSSRRGRHRCDQAGEIACWQPSVAVFRSCYKASLVSARVRHSGSHPTAFCWNAASSAPSMSSSAPSTTAMLMCGACGASAPRNPSLA